MLKVKPPEGYPPEPGRYVRGNDYSPVAVCVILDTFDFKIPPDLQELVLAATDAGAALAGMLQTENVGMEKMLCNIVANPNIRHVVLCGRESPGHLPGETLLALKQNGIDDKKQIIGSTAPTPYLHNIPLEVIERFNKQIVTVVGDYGFQFCMEELPVAVMYKIPFVCIVLNNGYLGLIRQAEKYLYDMNYQVQIWYESIREAEGLELAQMTATGEPVGRTVATALPRDVEPEKMGRGFDFVKFAEACGALGERVTDPKELKAAFKRGVESGSPYIIEVILERETDCPMGVSIDAIREFE